MDSITHRDVPGGPRVLMLFIILYTLKVKVNSNHSVMILILSDESILISIAEKEKRSKVVSRFTVTLLGKCRWPLADLFADKTSPVLTSPKQLHVADCRRFILPIYYQSASLRSAFSLNYISLYVHPSLLLSRSMYIGRLY